MPLDDIIKDEWIRAISVHQLFCSSHFMICERHFTSDDFAKKLGKNGKRILKKETIPSIFDNEPAEPFHPEMNCSITKKQFIFKRYCRIKYCPNEIGTESKDILFFR